MNVAIEITGCIGLSNAILLPQNNNFITLDLMQKKVDLINDKISLIVDTEIEEYLSTKQLNLIATSDKVESYKKTKGIEVVLLEEKLFFNSRVIRGYGEFKAISDVIVSNRMEATLNDFADKVYTRYSFGND